MCNTEKPIEEYWNHNGTKDKKRHECKSCLKERQTKWDKNNKGSIWEKKKEWRKNNPEKHRLIELRHRASDKRKETLKKWMIKNKEKLKQWRKIYRNQIHIKIRDTVSKRIHHHIGRESQFYPHWEKVIGYSMDELRIHIESKFLPGMNWDNYGTWTKNGPMKWHIDHIRPVSSFDIKNTSCEDFKKCWALSNLQPLWAIDNIKKSDKF